VTSIDDQYRIIISAAGWSDCSARGRLRFLARMRALLQALVSNDVSRLTSGEGVYATYLTPQGRMVADLELYRRPEGVMASVAPGLAAPLAGRFDQLVFSEDVRITDESAPTLELVVVGAHAPRLLGSALGVDGDTLARLPELAHIDYGAGFVARAGEALLPIFKLFAPSTERPDIVTRLETQGVVPVSDDLIEALRVEAGRPRFGVDMTDETIPLEAGLLERGISTTKGCYVGQEIIIRVLHRGGGRVAKRLVTLSFEADSDPPSAGARLEQAGREVGQLTSVAHSPGRETWVALGYVHRDAAEVGKQLTAGGSTVGTVTGFAS
jgi:folate-binding protein YgfZ